MDLPADFHFSQHSLQDYIDCPRRFELSYAERVDWPALQSEPVIEQEQLMQQGRRFHQMVQQALAGLPLEHISPGSEPELTPWWENFCRSGLLENLPAARYPEHALSATIGTHRLTARYDLLAVEPGKRGWIIDWKTARRHPGRAYLAGRMQTRVYPYLLVEAGALLNQGQPFLPGQVEMTYWFAGIPEKTVSFPYSTEQHAANHEFLLQLICEIARQPTPFPLTTNEKLCRFCRYRSFCSRGVKAGQWDDPETWPDDDGGLQDINLESADPIAF